MKKAEDLTGRRFGYLTVIGRAERQNGRTSWECRCDCGKQKIVSEYDLKQGRVKSCGCMRYAGAGRRVDLSGKRFGRLTVLYPTAKRDKKGSVYWMCRCDCGGQTEVTENGLMHGNNRSCGCLKKEVQDKINSQLHRVDGTCVEILEKRKYRRDNTSGFRGVYVTKGHRFRVSIGFKGKRYHVGTFDDYDAAVSARMEAEKLIHEGFIRAYYDWKERAEDSQWAKTHPFVYNVEKRNGKFCIVTENGQQTV